MKTKIEILRDLAAKSHPTPSSNPLPNRHPEKPGRPEETMKPSNFTALPMDSVAQNAETETIAANIMIILSRTGDVFRKLDWAEYSAERLKDGNFSERERDYFDKAIGYCVGESHARLFSPVWEKVGC